MVGKFLWDLRMLSLWSSQKDGEDDGDSFVQAAIIENQCLIIRIVEPAISINSTDQDAIILVDLKNLRPFAYYRISGQFGHYVSLQYLPEFSR